eukprot:12520668-Alexandrium_andersonii.AAC.1
MAASKPCSAGVASQARRIACRTSRMTARSAGASRTADAALRRPAPQAAFSASRSSRCVA